MERSFQTALAVSFGLSACLCAPATGAITLAEKGKSSARIFLKADDAAEVQAAAVELAGILKRMSGAEIPVAKVSAAAQIDTDNPSIVLGTLAEQLGLKMAKASGAKDGFRCKALGKAVLIVGESPAGVRNGAYAFLEGLGCGWYAPGEVGEVIPSRPSIVVADELDRCEVSDSVHRRFWYGGKHRKGEATDTWLRRNKAELSIGSWRHAWAGLVPAQKYFKEHPEYFSLNKGVRTRRQLCTTNEGTIRVAAEALMRQMAVGKARVYPAGPNDGGGLCQCPQCAKLDTPNYLEPTSGKPDCTDRIFQFANDLARITSRKFPGRDLGILIYSDYSRVPRKIGRIHPNVFPMFAPIRRCRFHGPGTPGCPLGLLWQAEIRGWARITGKLGFYIYNYNLADSLVPLSKISFYKRLAAEVHKADIKQLAWVFETIDSWSMHAPHLYLSARLSWDSSLDIDAEMDRYFKGFYAEAAGPMRRYWLRIDSAYENATTHTGSQYGLHHIWTDALRKSCRADIEEASGASRTARVKQAVEMAEAGLRCAELFMRIWNGLGAFEFAKAHQARAELKAHVEAMAARTDPSWAHERYAWGYYATFVGRTVSAGAKIVADGGQILVKLPDVWKFAKDEKAVGIEQGWFQPDYDDSKWADFGTFWKSWSDQGIGTYAGAGWYRTSFTIPAPPGRSPAAPGRSPASAERGDLRLWFGGFDDNVDVYLNGRHLGVKKGFAKPAEFEGIGRYLKFGARNVLAVRVTAGGLAELGTGGIMMPVMIYRSKVSSAPACRADGGVPALSRCHRGRYTAPQGEREYPCGKTC